ncbi:ABC transporter ATP-binding protein [Paracoccus laeviglucosivorans]|uniref:Iron(III) transport system ATP-binding protein/putative spermidine/putrescine transport system ATP-binding protein n=1 Tax=Paracoccus laeviglucosivorans TaxID=1197861 RepID=A0A521FKU8_9RHOB|nr:ABC transporter ATP-binding protein [Paracoccus laeviglucosivorans]SMO96749.1 iron(III) transport system ATP-binding protein/putative spermidine/putrescine transport system ATP-binding protein [Paracoccus laeviglucosivorans]
MSIQVQNLCKAYGALTVVPDVSFDVHEGEFISLLGPSGCGKTTTLRCIAGLEESSGGVIRIGDKVVSDPARGISVPSHGRDIGMVFQSYAIWPHMTVAENVAFPLRTRNAPKARIAEQVDRALSAVELAHLRDRYPSELSGGQQQRVALARAIVGRPSILLFDEPLSNLDAKLRESTRTEIRRIQKQLNVPSLYVTHDQEEALSMSDRVIVMDKGQIQQIGTPQELYRAPVNRFVADFVGKASFVDVVREGSGAWRTPDGTVLPGTLHSPEGTAHQLMLRPESLLLDPQHVASDNISVPGRVLSAQYLGAVTEYLVQALGGEVRVHSPIDLGTDQVVGLSFRSGDCRIVAR